MSEQLGLFGEEEARPPLLFQVACHKCVPPRIITVVPVSYEWPENGWRSAEAWAFIAYRSHEDTVHPRT